MPQPFERIGNYYLTRFVESGGFGDVWQAQYDAGRYPATFAIKFVRQDRVVALYQLDQEAALWRKFNQSYFVKLISLENSKHGPILVSEYCFGGTLKARIGNPFLKAKAILIVKDLLAGLEIVHQSGVVHRDLKPSNILFDTELDYRPRITDFGISCLLPEGAEFAETRQARGTLGYAAPEVRDERKYGKPSDIWAIGVILYEMLVGKLPRSAIVGADIEETELPNELDPKLRSAILRAVKRDPLSRYPSASEMFNDLQEVYDAFSGLGDGEPVHARGPGAFPNEPSRSGVDLSVEDIDSDELRRLFDGS